MKHWREDLVQEHRLALLAARRQHLLYVARGEVDLLADSEDYLLDDDLPNVHGAVHAILGRRNDSDLHAGPEPLYHRNELLGQERTREVFY